LNFLKGKSTYLPENIHVINGSLRLSANRRTVNNTFVLTGSGILNPSRNWNQGLFEVRVKIPNDNEFEPLIWLRPIDQESPKIILFSVLNSNPVIIQSGLLMESNKFAGFEEPFYNKLIANDFNVFSMEWRRNYICWKVNGQLYWNETIYKYLDSERYNDDIKQLFASRFFINLGLRPDHFIHPSLKEYSQIPSYFYIDYIKVYYRNDSNVDNSLEVFPDDQFVDSPDNSLENVESFGGISIPLIVLGLIAFFMIVFIAIIYIYLRRKVKRQSKNIFNQKVEISSLYDNNLNIDEYDNYQNESYYDIIDEYEESKL